MIPEYFIVFFTLVLVLILFVHGKIRHDFVALIALFVLVVTGLIPPASAFEGFGHPAVITVAAILVVTKALEHSGLIDVLGKWVLKTGKNVSVQILVLSLVVAVASAFMNNVGALAIMMPVAIHLAREKGKSPALYLMPVAFASLLGGMTTLIGTPPNIIIATFREEELGQPFGMFDFSQVGIVLAVAGVIFLAFLGWRLMEVRKGQIVDHDFFDIDDYITEIKLPKNSEWEGKMLLEMAEKLGSDKQILGVVRDNRRLHIPLETLELKADDIVILETDTKDLDQFLKDNGVELVGGKKFRIDAEGSKDISITEVVVMPNSPLINNTASGLRMRSRYGINLLAVARKDQKIMKRLDHIIFRIGDVLLLQGRSQSLNETIRNIGCLPLAKRGLKLGYKRKIPTALAIFSIAITLSIAGALPIQISFTMAAVAMVLFNILPIKEFYTSIDWAVIVLLAAMIPVGTALETSGGAQIMGALVLDLSHYFPPWVLLGTILIVTMFLSDLINNAATVVLMAPIAMSVAKGLEASIDPFLMAVAIGGSCAFLTPIGHQSNTLVMGPGGYKFTDYWKMGLPLEILIILIGVPMILFFWPLYG